MGEERRKRTREMRTVEMLRWLDEQYYQSPDYTELVAALMHLSHQGVPDWRKQEIEEWARGLLEADLRPAALAALLATSAK